jgi:hypothetical protein
MALALFCGFLPMSSGALDHIPISNRQFTEFAFPIGAENIDQVLKVSPSSLGYVMLVVRVAACYKRYGKADMELRVRGARAAIFHAGQYVATAGFWKDGRLWSAVRTIDRKELATWNCKV